MSGRGGWRPVGQVEMEVDVSYDGWISGSYQHFSAFQPLAEYFFFFFFFFTLRFIASTKTENPIAK